MTTIKQFADQHEVKISDVKRVLRRAHPGLDVSSPDYAMSSEQVRHAAESMRALRDERRHSHTVISVDTSKPLSSAGDLPIVAPPRAPHPPRETPTGAGHRILVHVDVLAFLESRRGEHRPQQSAVKRLLRGMLVEGRAQRSVKGTRGVNRGWLRAPIGDNGGSHYYLWHALAGTPCVSALDLARGEVAIRAVAHHDDTGHAMSSGARGDYLELDAHHYVSQVEQADDDRADVLSLAQREAYDRPDAITITKGHPGAGKTTLHLERTRRHDGLVVFITFGAAQRAQGERWLETYAPAGQTARAWTHHEFFQRLDPTIVAAMPTDEGIAHLATAVSHVSRLGPWRDQWHTLYGELRAWYWGRALPVDFRGVDGVTTDDDLERAYRQRRQATLSPAVLEGAVAAARALDDDDRRRLFGDLDAARAIATRLRDGDHTLVADLHGLDALLIDEVQDLTLVEALVCVLVAQQPLARAGRRPAFHVAGDEGQTVRATDFDWGELKDLVNSALGAPIELELPGNLRSPKTITQVINNSWSLYRSLGKGDRPRGYAAAEVDEAAIGSVLWVEFENRDLPTIAALADATPGGALIYPDVRIPHDVRLACPRVVSVPEAKGLDFRVAFVLDAGRLARAVVAGPRLDDARLDAIATRLAVDSIRVALSRATEVLVLLERPLDAGVRSQLTALCSTSGQLLDGVVTDVPVAELRERLDLDTSDRIELVTNALAQFTDVFEDDPLRGFAIIDQARGWMGDSARMGAVQGELRRQVYRARALALLRIAPIDPALREERFTTANREANNGKDALAGRLALEVRDAFDGPDRIKPALQRIHDVVRDGPADLARIAVVLLTAVLEHTTARATSFMQKDWERTIDALPLVPDVDGAGAWPALAASRTALALDAVRWALAQPGKAATTLADRALHQLAAPHVELHAQVAERKSEWDRAIELYRQAGRMQEALRVARTHDPDGARARSLAQAAESPELPLLERLARIETDLAATRHDDLTPAERERVLALAKQRLGRR